MPFSGFCCPVSLGVRFQFFQNPPAHFQAVYVPLASRNAIAWPHLMRPQTSASPALDQNSASPRRRFDNASFALCAHSVPFVLRLVAELVLGVSSLCLSLAAARAIHFNERPRAASSVKSLSFRRIRSRSRVISPNKAVDCTDESRDWWSQGHCPL